MAANFWTSTHYKQLLDPEEVDVVQQLDRERGITLDDVKLVKMHISNYITKMAQLVKVRQRVVATAITYMRRVYTRKSLTEFDPRLVALTSLYLAAKAEESTVQARLLVFYIKKIYPEDIRYRFDIKDILEMEMKILEAELLFSCISSLSFTNSISPRCWHDGPNAVHLVKNISMEILDFYDSMKNNIEERVNVIFSKLPSRS